ncbi:hypothetical protein [Streptomyces sp. MUM 16J]|nr:hypothetical protein [Streptomyces sp. MUM 16J]
MSVDVAAFSSARIPMPSTRGVLLVIPPTDAKGIAMRPVPRARTP